MTEIKIKDSGIWAIAFGVIFLVFVAIKISNNLVEAINQCVIK